MKNIKLSLTLTLTFILGFFLQSYGYQGEIGLNLPPQARVQDVITIEIPLRNSLKIKAFDLTLEYDGDHLKTMDGGLFIGELLNSRAIFTSKNEGQGEIRFLGAIYDRDQTVQGEGILLYGKLQAIKSGLAKVKLKNIYFVDENFNKISLDDIIGEINIIEPTKNSKERNKRNSEEKSRSVHRDVHIDRENGDKALVKITLIPNIYGLTPAGHVFDMIFFLKTLSLTLLNLL